MVLEMILNGLWMVLLVFFYVLEAAVRLFIKPARKDVGGKIVLVTGAGSGIGQGLAIEFAKLGSTVIGWDISEENLNETARRMRSEVGRELHSYTCDLSNREAIYKTADKVKKEVGKVDILINNAGIVSGKRLLECSDSLMQKTLEVNTTAHFWTLKAFLPDMLSADDGHIVTIASAAGFFGVPGQVDYAASKFGAVGLTEALYQEIHHLGKAGVHVTCVCPGYIDTGMFDGVNAGWFPMLDKDAAVDKIVDAILRNQYLLMMPRILYIIAGLKNILPTKVLVTVGKYTGASASMDQFVGRKRLA